MHFVFCQISNKLINPNAGKGETTADEYYESLYANKEKDGYYRSEHFWELPLWIGEATYALQGKHDCSLHIVTDVTDPLPIVWTLGKPSKTVYCFSVLDVNKAIVADIIRHNPDYHFALGGYIDSEAFLPALDPIDWIWFDSLSDMCDWYGTSYKYGVDWSLVAGVRTIPRLTMSYGCTNKCSFCTVPDEVVSVESGDIWQQIQSFRVLDFRLVYMNDKTFGQAGNSKDLGGWYRMIKSYNPKFRGFIVQTTCQEVLKRDVNFWSDNHIKIVELGIETFNDNLLKKYNKPQNERTITKAVNKLFDASDSVDVIANVVLGFPGETRDSYRKTLCFLHCFPFYALNIYTLALYGGTKLANDIGITDITDITDMADSDELAVTRSFWTSWAKVDFDHVSPLFYQLGIDKVVL